MYQVYVAMKLKHKRDGCMLEIYPDNIAKEKKAEIEKIVEQTESSTEMELTHFANIGQVEPPGVKTEVIFC